MFHVSIFNVPSDDRWWYLNCFNQLSFAHKNLNILSNIWKSTVPLTFVAGSTSGAYEAPFDTSSDGAGGTVPVVGDELQFGIFKDGDGDGNGDGDDDVDDGDDDDNDEDNDDDDDYY